MRNSLYFARKHGYFALSLPGRIVYRLGGLSCVRGEKILFFRLFAAVGTLPSNLTHPLNL